MNDSIMLEVAKPAPPVAIVAYERLSAVTLPDVVLYLTAIYTVLMIYSWVRRYLRSRRLADTDPSCAEDCPVARRLIEERDKAIAK